MKLVNYGCEVFGCKSLYVIEEVVEGLIGVLWGFCKLWVIMNVIFNVGSIFYF